MLLTASIRKMLAVHSKAMNTARHFISKYKWLGACYKIFIYIASLYHMDAC